MESDEAKKLTKHGEQAPSAYKYVLLCLSPVMRKGLLFPCNQIYGKVPLYKDMLAYAKKGIIIQANTEILLIFQSIPNGINICLKAIIASLK